MRIRTRSQYKRVGQSAIRYSGRCIHLEVRENRCGTSRLGITVTKRFGNACQRNRFKRLAREAFRLAQHRLPKGIDLLVKPRSQATKAKMMDIQNDFNLLPNQ